MEYTKYIRVTRAKLCERAAHGGQNEAPSDPSAEECILQDPSTRAKLAGQGPL